MMIPNTFVTQQSLAVLENDAIFYLPEKRQQNTEFNYLKMSTN